MSQTKYHYQIEGQRVTILFEWVTTSSFRIYLPSRTKA